MFKKLSLLSVKWAILQKLTIPPLEQRIENKINAHCNISLISVHPSKLLHR